MIQKLKAIKERICKFNYLKFDIKTSILQTTKHLKKVKRQMTNWENIFRADITYKVLLSLEYKELKMKTNTEILI